MPIIKIKEIGKALKANKDRCLAVSPIINNMPVSGPAAKYMKALGYEVSCYSIACMYKDYISRLIIDESDQGFKDAIDRLGVKAYATDIIIKDREDSKRLADFIKAIA